MGQGTERNDREWYGGVWQAGNVGAWWGEPWQGMAGLASRRRFWFVAVRHGRRGRDWTGTFRRGGVWFNFLREM